MTDWQDEAPGLSADDLLRGYAAMVRCRRLEAKGWDLVRQNKVHFAIASPGHEGAAAGYALAMAAGRDHLSTHYRDVAALLLLGMTPVTLLSTLYGNSLGVSGGRQPYGYWGAAHLKVLSGTGPQPNTLTHAVGVAAAAKLLHADEVTWMAFGDGGSSRGEFHEGLNFSAIHRLPIVFVCENNGYCQSVPQAKQSAQPDVALHAAGYGIPGVIVDGMDVLAVYRAARDARARSARGEGPTLIEAKTYRYLANTSNDDDRKYRTREEVTAARERDPIPAFAKWLTDAGIADAERLAEIDAAADAEIAEAQRTAESAPLADPAEAQQHTYATAVGTTGTGAAAAVTAGGSR